MRHNLRLVICAALAAFGVVQQANGQGTASLDNIRQIQDITGLNAVPVGPIVKAKPGKSFSVQVHFRYPEGAKITRFGERQSIVAPARSMFKAGGIYRLKISDIPDREGLELYPTLELAPVSPRTETYLTHSALPLSLSEEDIIHAVTGNHVTRVIYMPDAKYQDLAIAGIDSIVSTRLDPGVDPIAEADRRGTILAIVRLGNRQLAADEEKLVKARDASRRLSLDLRVGDSHDVRVGDGIANVLVSDNAPIRITINSKQEMSIEALEPGVGTVVLKEKSGGQREIEVHVIADTRPLERTLKKLYPEFEFELTPVPAGVVITGRASSPDVAQRVVEIAEQFYPSVLNHLDAPDRARPSRSTTPERAPRRERSETRGRGQREIRELRREVGELREDVKRLIRLLESSEPASDDSAPKNTSGASFVPLPKSDPATVAPPATPAELVRTKNFVVKAIGGDADRLARQAEEVRAILAEEWLGETLPDWSKPCLLDARVGSNLGSGGSTTYQFHDGKVGQFRCQLQGSSKNILGAMKHEVMHMVLASYFGKPLPRWVAEGICCHVEDDPEQAQRLRRYLKTNRMMSLSKLMKTKDYPTDVMPFFAQSQSLLEFLLEITDKETVIDFLRIGCEEGDWEQAFLDCFGFDSLNEAAEEWLDELSQT